MAGHLPHEIWRARRASPLAEDQSGVWRFREVLPKFAEVVSLREGNTPLYDLPRLASQIGVSRLWAKHLGMNPTGSFKDAGMTVAVSGAKAEGSDWVACASTGNTSASMAAYAARAGMRSLALVPAGHITPAKLAQAMEFGARVCQLRTDFDGCFRLLAEIATRASVYVVNSTNPLRLEGQKTAAFEIAEALEWRVPDHIVVPGGNLGNSSALGQGFLELSDAGLTERLPQLSIVQAAGANPLVRSWRKDRGHSMTPLQAETRATAIRIGNPASWRKAVRVLEQTGGTAVDVSEDEIASAKAMLGREGVACEPASAAALAGTMRLVREGHIAPDAEVALVLTGHTLKDPDYIAASLPPLGLLDAEADAILRALEGRP